MATATMTSSLNRSGTHTEFDRHVDGFLGALVSLCGTMQKSVRLSEVRARVSEMAEEEFDRVLMTLDRDGVIVMDRGDDGTMVRIASTHLAAPNAPQSLIDRIVGAVWAVSGPYRIAPLSAVRARLADVSQVQFERALAAAMIVGEIERTIGYEGPAVRIAPYAYAMHGPVFGVNGVNGTNGHYHHGLFERAECLHAKTREVAQRLWDIRGRQHGAELRDWLDAERMVREGAAFGIA